MSAPRADAFAAGRHGDASTASGAPRNVTAGLWVWHVAHPNWTPGGGWSAVVNSTCIETGGETVLIDPLAPDPLARELWARFDARPPTVVAVLKPDHIRDVDLFVRRYGARAFRPDLFAPDAELRVWLAPWHEQRTRPALRALLELPFVHEIVAHGEPGHERSAFEQALEAPPWTEEGSG